MKSASKNKNNLIIINKHNKMKKDLIKKVSKYFLYALLCVCLFSCTDPNKDTNKKFGVIQVNDNGWSTATVFCDSVNMVSKIQATIFVDGIKA